MAFCVQGDKKNEWWFPTPNQKKAILPIYKKWLKGLGQGNMMYPGTEVTATANFDGFTYSIFMAGPGSYIQNISHDTEENLYKSQIFIGEELDLTTEHPSVEILNEIKTKMGGINTTFANLAA